MSLPTSGSVRWCLAGVLAVSFQPPAPRPLSPAPRPLAIVGATVVIGDGQPPLPNVTVIIDGRWIRQFGPAKAVAVPKNAQVVDGRGKFLVPGLWDAHVHMAVFPVNGAAGPQSMDENGDYFLPLFVANGVTSVRDMGGDIDVLRTWRTQITSGQRLGPRMFITGKKVGSGQPIVRGGPSTIKTRADLERMVSLLSERGADFVKAEGIDLAKLTELGSIAKAHHLPLAGHLAAGVAMADAARAGMTRLEHLQGAAVECSSQGARLLQESRADRGRWGRLMVRIGFWNLGERERGRTQQALESQDPASCDSLASRLIAAGAWVTPTLIGLEAVKGLQRPNPPEVQALVPPGVRDHGEESPVAGDFERAFDEAQRRIVGRFQKAGVRLLAGTDLPGARTGRVPGVSLIDELEHLVEAGLTPIEAIRAATAEPSRALGVSDSLGTVTVGKIADLVLVDRDPLAAIGNLRSVVAVFIGGRYLPRAELDQLRASVRSRIAQWEAASPVSSSR